MDVIVLLFIRNVHKYIKNIQSRTPVIIFDRPNKTSIRLYSGSFDVDFCAFTRESKCTKVYKI